MQIVDRTVPHIKIDFGFTLMELLTAIGIAAVLIALIVPAVLRAKSKAKSIACASNVHQHALAISQFTLDYGYYPLFIATPDQKAKNPGQRNTWITSVYPDMKAADLNLENSIFDCPGVGRPKDLPSGLGFVEYGYNMDGLMGKDNVGNLGIGGWGNTNSGKIEPVRDHDVAAPSSMIVTGDGVIGWNEMMTDGVAKIGRSVSESKLLKGSEQRVQGRHSKKLNIGFADGHVETLTLRKLFIDSTDEALSSWNRDAQPHRERL